MYTELKEEMKRATLQRLLELTKHDDQWIRTEALIRYVLSHRNGLDLVQIHDEALIHGLTDLADRGEFCKIYNVPVVTRKVMLDKGYVSVDQGVYRLLHAAHTADYAEATDCKQEEPLPPPPVEPMGKSDTSEIRDIAGLRRMLTAMKKADVETFIKKYIEDKPWAELPDFTASKSAVIDAFLGFVSEATDVDKA